MTTPSIVIPSTSIVLLDSTKYKGPIIVQLASLKTIGTLTTVRDIGGQINNQKPIILSTVQGVRFGDGSSSFKLVVPFDTVTFQPKTPTSYDILNTNSFVPFLPNTFASSFHASYIATNSSIAARNNIGILDIVSSLNQKQSTIFNGPVILNNSLTVSSPMTYITDVNAFNTDIGFARAKSFTVNSLSANSIQADNIDYISSSIKIDASTFVKGLIVLSSFTSQLGSHVLQVNELKSLTISTNIIRGDLLVKNNLFIPQIYTLSTVGQQIDIDSLTTNVLNITENLNSPYLIALNTNIISASISSFSTKVQYANNIDAKLTLYQEYNVSSFFINDNVTGISLPLWASNTDIYFGNTAISYLGQAIPSLPSTVAGLGSLNYLSSPNLSISDFSTGQIFSRTVSTNTLLTASLISPVISTTNIYANSLQNQSIRINNLNLGSASTYSLQTSLIRTNNFNSLELSILKITANSGVINTVSSLNVNTSSFGVLLMSSLYINNNVINAQLLNTSDVLNSSINTNNVETNSINSITSGSILQSAFIQTNLMNANTIYSYNNKTSTILINKVIFNDSLITGNLFFSSGIFYANDKELAGLDNTVDQIVSTTVGIGSLGYLSSIKWLPNALSSKQIFVNNIFTSSFTGSTTQFNTLFSRNLLTSNLALSSLSNRDTRINSLVTNQNNFSSLNASFVATQNLNLNNASIRGNDYVFTNLTTGSAFISSISSLKFATSSILSRNVNIRAANSSNAYINDTISRVFQVANYTLDNLNARNTNAIRTDVNLLTTNSIYAPIVGINNFIPQNILPLNLRITASSLVTSSISTINTTILNFGANNLLTSSVRTSTLLFTDTTSYLEIFGSNSRLYVNGDWLQLNDTQNRTLISTVNGLGQIPYISSYKNNLIALSSFATYVNNIYIQGLNATNIVVSSIGTSTLTSLSSVLQIVNSRNINTSRFVVEQVRVLQTTGNIYTRNMSTGNILVNSINTNILQNRSTLYTYTFSSINIPTPSLSSVSLTANNLLVNSLTVSTMTVNLVSTGIFQTLYVVTTSTFTNQVSSSLINTSTINADTISSLQINSDNASFSSLSLSLSYFNNISTLFFNNINLSTNNMYSSDLTLSTIFIGLTLNVSSGILALDQVLIPSSNTIQNLVTSTSIGLGSYYLSSYSINSLSNQFVAASSFSTGQIVNLSSILNYVQISSASINKINASSITTSSITVNQSYGNVNSQTIKGPSQIQNIYTSSLNVSSIYAEKVFALSTQFVDLTISSLQPQNITGQNGVAISTAAKTLSVNNIQTNNISISSLIASSIIYSNYSTTVLNSLNLQASSMNVSILFTNNLKASSGLFSSINVNSLQLYSTQSSNLNTVNLNAGQTETKNGLHSQLTAYSISSYVIESINTNTNSLISLEGNASNLNIPINTIQEIQTSSLNSSSINTNVLSSYLIYGHYFQTSSLKINQGIASTVFTNNPSVNNFSFFGNILSYSYPYLYLNNVNVTTLTDASLISVTAGQTYANLLSTHTLQSQLVNTNVLNVYSTTVISSTTVNASIKANSLGLQNFNLLSTNLLFLSSSSVRATTIIASSFSTNLLQYNSLTYANINPNSLIASTLNTQTLSVSQSLKISSFTSSNIVLAAEGAYGMFYNSIPVGTSTFTSSVTTVVTNGTIYVAGGASIPSFWGDGPIGSTTLATSIDGKTWIPSAYQAINNGVNRVIWTGNQFIAVGKGSATIASSPDGINWTSVLTSSILTSVNDIVQGKRAFVAVGQGEGRNIVTSVDGLNWSSSVTNISSLTSIATNGTVYVAGGLGLATSLDGTNWTKQLTTNQINDIGFNGTQFIAVGQDGIRTSIDGTNWLIQLSTLKPKQLTWDGLQWLAAGQSSIYYSKDGVSWSNQIETPLLASTFTYVGLSTLVTAPPGTNYVKIQIWGAGGAGGISTFNPYYLANNQLWLDASDQNTILLSTNTSTVLAWADKSSNASLASTFVRPPSYYSTVLAFTSSTSLATPLFQNQAQTPFTVTFIGQINSISTNIFPTNLTVSSSYLLWQSTQTQNKISTNSTIIVALTTTLSTLTWRINGQEDSVQGSFYKPNGLVIGQGHFQLNEAIFFNSNMQLNTIQQVEGYFANKWSTLTLLPQNHPYISMSSINSGGGGAYVEGIYPLESGIGSTFGIFTGQGGQFNVSTGALGAYYNQKLYFSTSGGISYDVSYNSFQPTSFSSLGLWLDGSDPLGNGIKPLNGAQIDTWTDKSSKNRHASNIGSQDGYYSNGYMYFSSSAYQIDYQKFNSTAYTIFTVQLLDANEGTYQTLLSGGDGQPSLFSGVLSNNIATFTGRNEYNDTDANTPLIDATSWHLTDMLVSGGSLLPFVDGSIQTQKIGFTGSFSTLFLGALSPNLQTYIGSKQNISVYNAYSEPSTFVITNSISTFVDAYNSDGTQTSVYVDNTPPVLIDIYNPGQAQSTLVINHRTVEILLVDDYVSPVQNYVVTYAPSTIVFNSTLGVNIDVYDSNGEIIKVPLDNTLPINIDVYDPSQLPSTLVINHRTVDLLIVEDYISTLQNFDGAISTLFINDNISKNNNIAVYNPNAPLSSLTIKESYLDSIMIKDFVSPFPNYVVTYAPSTVILNSTLGVNIDVYDANGEKITVSLNNTLPVNIDIYDPSQSGQTSTLVINHRTVEILIIDDYISTLQNYDDNISTIAVYKPRIEIENWRGRVGEVLCFDTALSLNQRQLVEGYLASKWNLQSNLPLNHPYRYQNIYLSSTVKGAGGGGAASGVMLPNGQFIIAAGGGGGGQGTSWDGGGGGLDTGQRGSFADQTNSFGYSVNGTTAGGGGSSNQGGQGALASNGAVGGTGIQGQGGSGGIDSFHVVLPGGGGGGGLWGGGGGALQASPGGGSSRWKNVAGFVPSFSYSMPAMGQKSYQGQGQGGIATKQGSNGLAILTFLSFPTAEFNASATLGRGFQNIPIGQIVLQSGIPLINSSIMIQSFNDNIVLNNTLYVNQSTNSASIRQGPVNAALTVNGSVSKTAGSFVIDDPTRPGYKIKHSFVESASAGDTLYKWLFSTVSCRFDYQLPSWFSDLNSDIQVWVQPQEFYQQGRGYVYGNTLSIETTADGLFEVLCVATRKDIDATNYFKSVEYR